MNQRENPDYIDELEEWNRNQFVSGHYTGGNIPPYIKYPGNPKRLAIVFLVYTVLYVISLTLAIVGFKTGNEAGSIVGIIVYVALSLIYLLAGISLFRKAKKK